MPGGSDRDNTVVSISSDYGLALNSSEYIVAYEMQDKLYRVWCTNNALPDSKVHRANMGPIWDRQDPWGPHVGPMNFAIWAVLWKNICVLQMLFIN